MGSISIISSPPHTFYSQRNHRKLCIMKAFTLLLATAAVTYAWLAPRGIYQDVKAMILTGQTTFQSCKNTPNSRNCWGEYSVDTNYITTIPDTGDTVEVWLSAEESICNPDGYERTCKTFNGSMPGPPIVANWGDDLIIHVTNNLKSNGTTVHWHGVRQLGTVQYDEVRSFQIISHLLKLH